MTNIEFVEKLKNIVKNNKTLYVMGCFGAPLNSKNKERYTKNYEYNKSRKDIINNCSSDTFGFDCVCLIKGVLWGFSADTNDQYGGSKYLSNNVPDITENEMYKRCYDKSNDFTNIEIGEFLHINGHCGIYIGSSLAIEATPIYNDGVQITNVVNIKKINNYNPRKWTSHAKLPYIEYIKEKNDKKSEKKYKHKINEYVYIKEVFKSSESEYPLIPLIKYGQITKIINAKNPYLLENGNIGWVNDNSIIRLNIIQKIIFFIKKLLKKRIN